MEQVKMKAAVYPYNLESAPIARHRDLLKSYTITSLISPSGWGINGCDACQADRGEEIGLMVTGGVPESLNSWEALIIPDVNPSEKLKGKILSNMELAIDNSKNIICALPLDKLTYENLQNKCNKKGVYFDYLCNQSSGELLFDFDEHLEAIEVPVVFVGGLTENTNKFEILLTVKKSLEEKGYKVSAIGTKNYSKLFGINLFPQFMLSTGISEKNKILLFNRYIKTMELTENPDAIIIGIPGGMMPFSSIMTNGFGVLAYMVSQAVSPDFSIISVLYDKLDPKYFEMLNTSFRYKFGFEINCFNMSNALCDVITSLETRQLHFNFLEYKDVDDIIQKKYLSLKRPLFNVLNSKDKREMSDLVISTLEGYGFREEISAGGIR